MLNDLGQLPGVEAVGITSFLPAAGNNWGIAFSIEGYVPPKGAGLNMASMSLVESDPFEALGIRVLRGRVFTESDNAGSPLVAIVNRSMAERYWPGQDAMGGAAIWGTVPRSARDQGHFRSPWDLQSREKPRDGTERTQTGPPSFVPVPSSRRAAIPL